jgi:hypothetical protein
MTVGDRCPVAESWAFAAAVLASLERREQARANCIHRSSVVRRAGGPEAEAHAHGLIVRYQSKQEGPA